MDILELVHDDQRSEIRPFECKFRGCPKAFSRACPYQNCGKTFIQRSALTVHTRVHTGERPHVCDTCLKAFSDSSSLARHRRIHSGRRPYRCLVEGCGKSYCRKTTLTKHTRRNHAAVIKSSHGRDQGTIGPVTIGSNSGPLPSFNFRAGMARSHSDMPSFIGSSFGNSGFGAPAEQQAGLLYYNTYSETNSNSIDGTQESAPTSRRSSADYHTSSSTMTQPQSPSVKSPPTAVYLHQSFAQPSYYYPTSASVLPPPPPAPSGDLYSPKGISQDEASGRHHHQPDRDYQHQHMQHHTPQHHTPQRGHQIMPSIDGQSSFASSELPSMDAPVTPLQNSSFPKSENSLPATTTSACFSFYEPSTPMPLSLQSPYNAHQQHHGHFSAPAHPQQQCQQQQPTVFQVRLPPLTPVQHFHHNQQQQQQTRYMSEHGAMRAQQLYAEGVTAKVEETHQ